MGNYGAFFGSVVVVVCSPPLFTTWAWTHLTRWEQTLRLRRGGGMTAAYTQEWLTILRTLPLAQNAIVHIPGLQVALEIQQRRGSRDGACALSLCSLYKQPADSESELQEEDDNESTRKPESFVWTVNEVKLLQLTLNCKASKLQERLNIFCSTNTSM